MNNGSGPTIFDLARNNTRAKLYLGAVVSADTKVLACHSPFIIAVKICRGQGSTAGT